MKRTSSLKFIELVGNGMWQQTTFSSWNHDFPFNIYI